MTPAQDDMREQLLAALQASPELPREDRAHLADLFLDDLNRRYRLVPRRGVLRDGLAGATEMFLPGGGFMPLLLIIAGVFLLLPVLVVSLFVLGHLHFLFLILVLFIVLRFAGFGRRRRSHPSRGGWV